MRCQWGYVVAVTLLAASSGHAQVPYLASKDMPAPASPQPIIRDAAMPPDVSTAAAPASNMTPPLAATPGTIIDVSPSCEANRFWIQGEYLFWWLKPGPLATPIVTTDPSQGVAKGSGGLANPTTQVLLGGHDVDFPPVSGGQVRAGYALGGGLGIEAGGFLFEQQTNDQIRASDNGGSPFLLRPIVNTDANNLNAGIVVSLPLSSALALGANAANTGAIQVNNTIRLWGADSGIL